MPVPSWATSVVSNWRRTLKLGPEFTDEWIYETWEGKKVSLLDPGEEQEEFFQQLVDAKRKETSKC